MASETRATPVVLDGRYELGEILGRGGMGEVRAGTDQRLGRPVAIKLLRADCASDPEIRRRFELEASAAAKLAHPNVVAVFDTGEEQGVPFIVMERLPGATLADRVAESPLPPDAVRLLGEQVLAALGAAHDAGLVHRDVKPGNVLAAGEDVWKVADFGIAKSVEAATDLTGTGMLVGTAAYLAPERIEGRPATPASDLYATGVLLYEAVSGRKPFDAETPIGLANVIRSQEPVPLGELCPDLDGALVDAVERAMEKDPRRRFASAAEMSGALGRARPATPPVPDAMAATEPAALAGGGGTAAMTEGMLPEPVVPGRRLLPQIPARAWLWVAAGAVAAVLVFGIVSTVRDDGGRGPAPTVTTDAPAAGSPAESDGSLPSSLDDALTELEESVQP